MEAYQYETVEQGLQLRKVPIPEPGPGQVRLVVKAAGMCHSDVGILNGIGESWIKKKPVTLGHEIAGVVDKLGPGVTTPSVGARVAVGAICHPADQMKWEETLGLGVDGGYAKFAIAPAQYLVAIPENVPFNYAAVATDSIATAYHAVTVKANVQPGQTVAIVGLGGLGLNAVRFAYLAGATVLGADINTSKFADATRLGATRCVERLEDLAGTTVDVVIDFAGTKSTVKDAIKAVKKCGQVVLVGLGEAEVAFDSSDLVTRGIELKGSLGSNPNEIEAVLALISEGKIEPTVTEVPFSEVAQGLDSLARGEVQGRLYTMPV